MSDQSDPRPPPPEPLTKSERERLVFSAVYNADDCHTIVHSDRPDFVVTLTPSGSPFGVEVTELYQTEADARLLHHATYFESLLKGSRLMHPDDQATLGVVTVTISDKDGNIKHEGVQALLRESVPDDVHSDAVASAVETKTQKAAGYDPSLTHVNLIVFDTFHDQAAKPGHEYCTSDLISPGLRDAILASPFDEIFLVTTDRDGDRWHRPLRMLLLLEAFDLVTGAIDAYTGPLPELDPEDAAPWFTLLTSLPDVELTADPWHGPDRATWGRYAVRSGETTELLDNHDLAARIVPSTAGPPMVSEQVLGPLRRHVNAFCAEQSFHCRFWFPQPGSHTEPG